MYSPSQEIRKILESLTTFKFEKKYSLFTKLEETLLLENMTPRQAVEIFKQYGANDEDISPKNIRKTRIKMVNQYHPDRTGGDHTILARLNAAYDVLSKVSERPSDTTEKPSTGSPRGDSSPSGVPSWQTDPRGRNSSYSSKTYKDQNWIKTRMWELSNRSKVRWTIYGFDGAFFRHQVTVFGNDKIFPEMAEAMIIFQTQGSNPYDIKAVLAQKESDQELYLIWINGKQVSPPEIYEFESFNSNPANDQSLVQTLHNAVRDNS